MKRKRAPPVPVPATRPGTLRPFWSRDTAALTSRLWLPPLSQTGVPAPAAHWFHTRVTRRATGSVGHTLGYDATLLDQWLATTEKGKEQMDDPSLLVTQKKARGTLEPPVRVRTRKIRVYPATEHQRALLPQWFGTARWTYNQCVTRIQQGTCKPTRSGGLREAIVNDTAHTPATGTAWVLNTPRDVRAGAYQDVIQAYASNYAKQRQNPGHTFTVTHRSRKAPQERIYIDQRAYKNGVIYPSKFGKVPFRSHEPLPATLSHDAHLIRTRLGHYYLCITLDVARRDDNQVPDRPCRVAAIDPGVRTPHTLYDPAGLLLEFGKGDMGHLYRLCYHMDQLGSAMDTLPTRIMNDLAYKRHVHRKRWRMRKAWHRASLRVRHLVDEYHKQVVHHLVTHYDVVLLPALETSRLVLRKCRKLTSKAARAMVTWAHYRFRQRLLWKGCMTGCKVVVCDEAYTSKTCGQCGWLHETLRDKKEFHCAQCGLAVDRDANGARNILLKNASRFGFRVEAALGLTPSSLDDREVHGPCGLKCCSVIAAT